jgi:hypothetical protein
MVENGIRACHILAYFLPNFFKIYPDIYQNFGKKVPENMLKSEIKKDL